MQGLRAPCKDHNFKNWVFQLEDSKLDSDPDLMDDDDDEPEEHTSSQ